MTENVSRRQFISVASALALLGGATITISGCSSSSNPSNPSSPSPSSGSGDKTANISGNHGHVATLTSAQLTAGAGLSLVFTGTATHTHAVDLTGAEVVSIRGGTRVAKESTTEQAHSHTTTFN